MWSWKKVEEELPQITSSTRRVPDAHPEFLDIPHELRNRINKEMIVLMERDLANERTNVEELEAKVKGRREEFDTKYPSLPRPVYDDEGYFQGTATSRNLDEKAERWEDKIIQAELKLKSDQKYLNDMRFLIKRKIELNGTFLRRQSEPSF